ncbi:hypothetical protein [Candidatus Deianiraea vastatrix]|uniref:Uncharacterized protein n=1 Tax=Candidatus Deianiraea vastatrix TaxID=2163644 RepID=A0A5B8XDS0_9RICK|nr:hypothetical protein [Candidatus Deianiraea vastatrix]QED23413.1 hypothetical protein Deia_00619 [Candidatus Deianiraea vastatrix]
MIFFGSAVCPYRDLPIIVFYVVFFSIGVLCLLFSYSDDLYVNFFDPDKLSHQKYHVKKDKNSK